MSWLLKGVLLGVFVSVYFKMVFLKIPLSANYAFAQMVTFGQFFNLQHTGFQYTENQNSAIVRSYVAILIASTLTSYTA